MGQTDCITSPAGSAVHELLLVSLSTRPEASVYVAHGSSLGHGLTPGKIPPSHFLSSHAAEGDGGSLTRMGQVIEAGWKVCIANKTVSCGAGEV